MFFGNMKIPSEPCILVGANGVLTTRVVGNQGGGRTWVWLCYILHYEGWGMLSIIWMCGEVFPLGGGFSSGTKDTIYSNLPLKYALWTGAIGAHLVGRCVLYSYRFLDPLEAIWANESERSGERMKPKAICLTEAQKYEIIAKLSKPNAPSKRALGQEYESSEGTIEKVLDTMCIKEEPPIDDKIHPIETYAKFESATDSKGFEVLYNLVLDIDDQLLCSNIQTKTRQNVW